MVGFDPKSKAELRQIEYVVGGAASGFVTRAICQPLDVIKIRFQIQEQPISPGRLSKYHGILQACRMIWKEEGVVAFWKGHNPAQVLSVVFGVVQFSSFELLTKVVWNHLPAYLTVDMRPATHFVCGGLSGCFATIASQPFDVIRTRFVAQVHPKAYHSVFDAVRQIVSKESPRGLYRGLMPALIQIAPQTGLQFGFYTFFTSIWNYFVRRTDKQPVSIGFVQSLFCGSGAGLCAKLVIYPLDVVKKRLQLKGFEGRVATGQARPYRGIIHCIQLILRKEGLTAFYRGLTPSLVKAYVTSGLHFATYERFCALLRYYHLRNT